MVKPPGKRTSGGIPTQFTAARQKVTEITTSPAIFCAGVRPRERLCATDSMSSKRPSAPVASMATMAQTSSGDHGTITRQVRNTPRSITAPPMVGVPCFTRWRCGPSARICWPMPPLFIMRMNAGMAMPTSNAAIKTAKNT